MAAAAPEAENLYERLGVDRSASADDVKRAYRVLALRCHPDKTSDPDATAKFQRISEAYAVLSDDQKRRNYDQFGEADMEDFNIDDFMAAMFAPDGGFGDIFAELMAMHGDLDASDSDEFEDMQASFASYLKATMGQGDPDGKVLMPDGSRMPLSAFGDMGPDPMMLAAMMSGDLDELDVDPEDEDDLEGMIAMMEAMGAMGMGGMRGL
eukprot:CAMPEP_0206048130 /NCGR_PEP_ID=MMETSP1466-20131121/23257_1 /ASSEMBLY_ACC=CAM_ASM_001126 /TAXON_ID=44452 /ORGANISM="Pavlova gyrans, Strain CCMP608" /LENGTH=208 /DNA_ID=CAMNT_0053423165 /DNA_START=10 /DNA_END=633 /DNA_ORIENTATION=+